MTFSKFAKQKRVAAGLSQQMVADWLSLNHRADVAKREKERVEWKFQEVISLAHILGEVPSEFIREFEDQE